MSIDLRRGMSVRANLPFIRESPAARATKSSMTPAIALLPPSLSNSERSTAHLPWFHGGIHLASSGVKLVHARCGQTALGLPLLRSEDALQELAEPAHLNLAQS